jgi:glycosyltransferase involved in cell wall biosynthesis
VKVLLIAPEFPPRSGGGIGMYLADLASELRRIGCDVDVAVGSAFTLGAESYEWDGKPVLALETARALKWNERFSHFSMFPELQRHLAAAFALHEQFKAGAGYDAVEVTDWGFLYLPWMLEANTRVLVQLHGSNGQIFHHEPVAGREAEGAFSTLLDSTALRGAPCLSSQSRTNAKWWKMQLNREVVYQPHLIALAPPAQAPAETSPDWLAIGRIQYWKGPQIACRAWEELGAEAPALLWMGRDTIHGASGKPTSQWLEREFPNTWNHKVRPAGRLSDDEWLQKLLAAKAVVVPSIWDVLNRVTIEAMALGKVVVVSDGAGVFDLIDHGVNGFVFPKGEASALAKLVRQVDRMTVQELRSMGERAQKTVREILNPDRLARAKLDLYKSIPLGANNDRVLHNLLFPGTTLRDKLQFLDEVSLRALWQYAAKRSLRKITSRR